MGSRYRAPEEHRIDISQGDWLIVKKHLTAGEERQVMAHTMKRMVAGQAAEVDPLHVGFAQVAVYLLDWSLVDLAGKKIEVRDQPYDVIVAALTNLPTDDFNEIQKAIEAHDKAMASEREYEKKARTGAIAPSATSASVS